MKASLSFDNLGQGRPTVGVKQASRHYLVYCQQFTLNTVQAYRLALSDFQTRIDKTDISMITRRDVVAYLAKLKSRGRSNNTINHRLAILRSFFRWAEMMYETINPTSGIPRYKTEPTSARFLSTDEYNAVEKLEGFKRDRIVFLANTGLRSFEFCNMKPRDISPDRKSLVVIGKGRKRRSVPLNSICRKLLTKPHLNISKSTCRPIHNAALKHNCKALAGQAGIPCFGPHALRHYFATSLLQAGVNIALVSRILGHSSIAITEATYIHITPDHLVDVTEVLADPERDGIF